MDGLSEKLLDLGRQAAVEQDRALALGTALPPLGTRSRVLPVSTGARPIVWIAPLAACAAIALAVVGARKILQDDPNASRLTWSVSEATGDGEVSYVSSEGAERELRFSDGTRIRVAAASAVRVVAVTPAEIVLGLEHGAASFDIVKSPTRHWRVVSGPFEVDVKGTQFDLSWNTETQAFGLKLARGRVHVRGECLAEERVVLPGGSLDLSCLRRPRQHATEPRVEQTDHTATAAVSESEPQPSSGLTRVEQGRARTSAATLLRTAERAALAGETSDAEHALEALRTAHPAAPEARTAAFLLGRIAFDRRHDYAHAARWFSTYLSEAPEGLLAREALGRLLEIHVRDHDATRARAVAEQYLARFPTGPHDSLARRALE